MRIDRTDTKNHSPLSRMAWLKLAVALLLLLPMVSAYAQFESASVLGYVRDNAGASVTGATVSLTNVATNITKTATTDSEGRYEINSVPIGNYRVEAAAKGFDRTRTQQFQLLTNARQRVDVALKIGTATEVVTVDTLPTQLETETSSRGVVISTHEIENLSINGRSYADLALLVPGVHKSFLETQGTTNREASFNVNGQRSEFNNFLLDGLDNNNYGTSNQGFANENIAPSPDALSEFRLETNNSSAEYGRATGAVINASVRRGTNQVHGRVWDYLRNTSLNAIGPFAPAGGTKSILIKNQFGGTLSGPIWKDHTFVFADYEALRQIFTVFGTATLPTAEQKAGTFVLHNLDGSTTPIPVQNPITGIVYATGVVPTTDQTAFAKAVFAALPGTNNGAALNTTAAYATNYTLFPKGSIHDDKGDIRVDHTFNQKLSLFGRYSQHETALFDPPTISGPAGGNANSNVYIKNKDIAVGVTYVISPSMLLDVRAGYSRNKGGKAPYGVGNASLLTQNGITDGLPTDPLVVRSLNAQNITGFSQLGTQPASPQFQNPNVFNPKVNFTWVHGIHSIKIGYEFQGVNTQVNDFNPSYGQDNYAGQYSKVGAGLTPGTAPNGAAQLQQAYNAADFLFGNRNEYLLTNFVIVNLRQRFNFGYIQDDIKLRPNLTVNVGLRYELVTPQYEADNKLANFDPGTSTLIQATSGSVFNRARVNMPKNLFAPRLGLAYSIRPNTVIRVGYGIGFAEYNREGGENNLTYNGPNVVSADIVNVPPTTTSRCTTDTQLQTACFRQTQQGYANTLTAPANFNPLLVQSRYIPYNIKTGTIHSYHLSVQQQLPHGIVMDLGYVGSQGRHLQILGDYNQASQCTAALATACPSGGAALQARRPIPNFAGIEIAFGGGTSNYNGLQFKTEKRFHDGLYFLNSFTWSRSFDFASGHLETANGDNSRVNIANVKGDYGPSGYDQPLINVTTVIYDLPYGHGRRFGGNSNYLMNALLGGWETTLVNTMNSGLVDNLNYTVSGTAGTATTNGLYTYRPNVSGNPVAPASNRVKTSAALTGYLNSANVSIPLTGNPYGNARRNSIRSLPFYQTDFGLHKAFQLWSPSSTFDFRVEAFNILNKLNYQAPDANRSNGTFGNITGFFAPRQLQIAAKIIF